MTQPTNAVLLAVDSEALALELEAAVRELGIADDVLLARTADDAFAALLAGGAHLAMISLAPSAARSRLEQTLQGMAVPILRFVPDASRTTARAGLEPVNLPFSGEMLRSALGRLGFATA